MMKCFEMYPSKVFVRSILDVKYNSILIEKSKELMYTCAKKNNASVRFGWQSDCDIYKHKEFHPLCNDILKNISLGLLVDKEITPYITSMWLNVHGQHGFNHMHVHSGAWYSGVYYIKFLENMGNIIFCDPRPGADNSFQHKQIEPNNYTIKPNTGDLIFFPAWLPHAVEPNETTEDRISLSFNIELNV